MSQIETTLSDVSNENIVIDASQQELLLKESRIYSKSEIYTT